MVLVHIDSLRLENPWDMRDSCVNIKLNAPILAHFFCLSQIIVVLLQNLNGVSIGACSIVHY